MPRICYAGTWERDYPRNRLMIAALRHAGARVEEAHVPVFERLASKNSAGAVALVGLAVRLCIAYLRLVPSVLLRLLRCDAVMVGYIGQIDVIVFALLARVVGRPTIFNPLVTLTDTVVEDRQLVRSGTLPARIIALLDRIGLHLCDVVLTDTQGNADYLVTRFGVHPQKVVVVPVGADEKTFYPAVTPTQHDVLDVVFIGKFIPLHGIETILRAAAILRDRQAPVRIELVGTGQTYAAMRDLARDLRLDTLVWTDWIPFDQLGDRLRRADVALGVFGAGAKAGRVIPNKVYQSLACGVATITRDAPDVARFLHHGEQALLVPPADALALADAIMALTDSEVRLTIARNGRQAFEKQASLPALARALSPVLGCVQMRGRP